MVNHWIKGTLIRAWIYVCVVSLYPVPENGSRLNISAHVLAKNKIFYRLSRRWVWRKSKGKGKQRISCFRRPFLVIALEWFSLKSYSLDRQTSTSGLHSPQTSANVKWSRSVLSVCEHNFRLLTASRVIFMIPLARVTAEGKFNRYRHRKFPSHPLLSLRVSFVMTLVPNPARSLPMHNNSREMAERRAKNSKNSKSRSR
jgi:hypothetical protein